MQTSPSLPATFFLMQGMTQTQKEQIDPYFSEPICYQKGETLYSTHCYKKALGVVLSGTVTVRSEKDNGKSVLLRRLLAGDCFGAAALFDDTNSDYVSELVASTDVCVRYITQEQMSTLFALSPLAAQNYITFLSGRIRFLNRKLATLTNGSSISRLYHYCLTHEGEDGTVQFPASMIDLARLLNMGRSSLYRSLDTLLSDGILSKDGKTYILNK